MGAVGDHPVAHLEAADAGADLDHHARVAVAEGNGLVELGQHRAHGGPDPVGAELVQHLAHLVGLLPGLVYEARAPELQQHALRAGGDEGVAGADQQVPGTHEGNGHGLDPGLALPEVLEYLLHFSFASLSSRRINYR